MPDDVAQMEIEESIHSEVLEPWAIPTYLSDSHLHTIPPRRVPTFASTGAYSLSLTLAHVWLHARHIWQFVGVCS